jgi:hypothetical protein
MDTNKLADTIYSYLITKHARVYRNEAPTGAVFPYVVFDCESVLDTYPSDDYYVYVDIYESPNQNPRAMTTLADSIDLGINHQTFNVDELNAHFTRINRQFVSNAELVSSKMIDIQYSARVYFK